MHSTVRWANKAWQLCMAHPIAALKCSGMLLLPALLWAIVFVVLYELSPWGETIATSGLGLQFLVSLGMAAVFMPFVSGVYACFYGFCLDEKFTIGDFYFGLSRPLSSITTFFGSFVLTLAGLFFFGGASSIWAMPVQAVSNKKFPENFRFVIQKTTVDITTLFNGMGALVLITLMGFIPIGVFSLCWILFSKAGDFLATLLILLSPILFFAWLFFPFTMLVQAIRLRDEWGLEEGPFEGRLKVKTKSKEKPAESRPKETPQFGESRASKTIACPVCQSEVPRQARFCPNCRSPIGG